jgi:hypothetical protein
MNNFKNINGSTKINIILILLVIVATLVAIYYAKNSNPEKKPFYARSMNDASYDCEDKIISKFKDSLVIKTFDNFSSRYEANKRQYLIYYRISVKEKQDNAPTIKDYMAKCVVWERLGYVSNFSVFEI